MKLILLGGNSIENKEWIVEVQDKLSELFDSTYVWTYEHWKDESKSIDFDIELKKLENYIENLNDEYIIFAKSAGSILTLIGIEQGFLNPSKVIFLGFAYHFAKKRGLQIDRILKNNHFPTLLIQKEFDPAIGCQDLSKKTIDFTNYKLIQIDGDNHHYEDLNLVKNIIVDEGFVN